MLGALECELPNGKRFDVGSGFNMAQRRAPPKINSVITFKFQELSNAGHPRFPVFLRMRTDLTWADVLEAAKTKTPVSTTQKVIPSAKLSKQHSILFSVIPSREESTGKKIVTSDDEDEDAAPASTKPAQKRNVCQYGAKCFRTNADHLKEYEHPSVKKPASGEGSKTQPPCAFGAKCYRTSSVHLATYSHPAKSTAKNAVDAAAEEEILDQGDLIEPEEPRSPTVTDNLLVKDKNKGLTFDDVDDDDNDEVTLAPPKAGKRSTATGEPANGKRVKTE